MSQVIKAAIMNYIRNKKTLLFNFIFPIFLVLILGTVLSSAMNTTVEVDEIEIYYIDEGNEQSKEVLSILKDIGKDMDFIFKEEDSLEEGKDYVRINKAILLNFNDDDIEFYSNDKYLVESSTVYGVLTGITDRFNATVEMFKIDPTLASEIAYDENIDSSDYFTNEKITSEKSPTAFGYYGIAELGLMVFYFISTPIYHLNRERKNNIKDRIKLSGISNTQYFLGSFIGYSIVTFTSLVLSYLVLKFIVGVGYGDNIFILPLAALPFIFLVIAIGILFSIIFKEIDKAENVLNSVIIPVLCFLGGGYVAFDDIGGLLGILSNISPLRWFNRGVLRYVYLGDSEYLINWLILGTVVTLLLILVIIFFSKREEKING